MARVLFACGTDNDGYPTCMGDTSTCAPEGQCKGWPPDDLEPCDWKVNYWTPEGYKFTAYLDNITHNHLMAYGTEKHTDRPVVLTRDSVDERWTEAV